jgi:hypothetical protein
LQVPVRCAFPKVQNRLLLYLAYTERKRMCNFTTKTAFSKEKYVTFSQGCQQSRIQSGV